MNKRKKIFIGLGLIILIFTLFVGSYVIRQNLQQEMLAVSEVENSEDIIETDTPITAEYETMVGNEVTDNEVIDGIVDNGGYVAEEGDGSGMYGDPAAKLDAIYEDAMASSDLMPFEKEMIRLIVEKEGKTFEEALVSVRPGSKVVEQTETQTPSNNQNTEKPSNNTKPTTPTKPTTTPKKNEGDSGGADYNNPDTRTDAQKEADANDPFDDGIGGKSGDISHEPEF